MYPVTGYMDARQFTSKEMYENYLHLGSNGPNVINSGCSDNQYIQNVIEFNGKTEFGTFSSSTLTGRADDWQGNSFTN